MQVARGRRSVGFYLPNSDPKETALSTCSERSGPTFPTNSTYAERGSFCRESEQQSKKNQKKRSDNIDFAKEAYLRLGKMCSHFLLVTGLQGQRHSSRPHLPIMNVPVYKIPAQLDVL